jgi:hypothetical protein
MSARTTVGAMAILAAAAVFIVTARLVAAPPPATTQGSAVTELEQRISALEARVGTAGPINISGSPWNDVRAFGAVGDGTRDDGPAIQKAIDALHRAGGGTLLFPPGRYRVTGAGLSLRNRVTLAGIDTASSQLIFDQQIAKEYLINLTNDAGEYAPDGQHINSLRLVTAGGGAVRDRPMPGKDGTVRGWHHGGMSNVVIEGGARSAYAIELPHYAQQVVLENVTLVNFFGPMLHIDGNFNVLRNVGPESWAHPKLFRNFDKLPMISIAGDSNELEHCLIETFSGFPALAVTGYRHRVIHMWAESDGSVPGDAWIVLNDAHQILFDSPHVLTEGTHKLKLVNSDATVLLLEPKHIQHSVDLDPASSLSVLVAARSVPPGIHVVHPAKP